MRAVSLSLAIAALLAAAPAAAQSKLKGSFELGAGNYTPDIDSDVPAGNLPDQGGPYEEMFGDGRGWIFRVNVARALYSRYGTFEVGVLSGFSRRSADAYTNTTPDAETPTWVRSGDTTSLNIIPTTLTLTYRLDVLVDRQPAIPIAPYVRLSLERYNWWISDSDGMAEKGATNGWSVTGGLAFALDWLDQGRGREMDTEFGIKHTYLYVDVTKSFVDDFGSGSSWDLSGNELMLSAGLMFAY